VYERAYVADVEVVPKRVRHLYREQSIISCDRKQLGLGQTVERDTENGLHTIADVLASATIKHPTCSSAVSSGPAISKFLWVVFVALSKAAQQLRKT
jgi:hypothetical protein